MGSLLSGRGRGRSRHPRRVISAYRDGAYHAPTSGYRRAGGAVNSSATSAGMCLVRWRLHLVDEGLQSTGAIVRGRVVLKGGACRVELRLGRPTRTPAHRSRDT